MRFRFLILLPIIQLLIGCGGEVASPDSTPIPANNLPADAQSEALMLMWGVPKDSVDGYLIKFGYAPDDLQYSIRVDRDALERIDHPQFGAVYRYGLRGLASDRPVYVTLSAIQGDSVSPPSDVMQVPPRH